MKLAGSSNRQPGATRHRAGRILSYDPKVLDQLMLELEAAGNPLAARIRAARREGQRARSLGISRER